MLCHSDRSPCPIAHALDILGDRWTLLIIRDMLFRNIHEYKDLLNSPEGIATNILCDRLKKLVDANLIHSIEHPENKTRKLYYLTPSGKKLAYPLMELLKWARDHFGDIGLPPELKEQLNRDPSAMIEAAFKQLNDWEQVYLTAS